MTNRVRNNNILFQAAIIGSCLFFLSCENDEKLIDAWTGKKEMVEVATQVTSYFSQQGNVRARLTAPEMRRYQSDTVSVEFSKSLHVDFYDSLKRVESWVDAKYGKYYESLNKVFLRDSVKVLTTKGDKLETSELWWDQNSKTFYTDKVVRISQNGKNITGGKGLEAAQDLSWYLIKHPTGTVLVGDDVMPPQQ